MTSATHESVVKLGPNRGNGCHSATAFSALCFSDKLRTSGLAVSIIMVASLLNSQCDVFMFGTSE